MTSSLRTSRQGTRIWRLLASVAAASVVAGGAAPVLAQQTVDTRLNKVEAEVRALQRKVFPSADGKTLEPEIKAVTGPSTVTGQPATTPVTDLLTRMDAIEAQMARLTSQVEQNTNRINLIEAKIGTAAQPAAGSPVLPAPSVAPAPSAAPAPQPGPAAPTASPAPLPPATAPVPAASAPKPVPKPAATPAPAPSARVEAVKAIEKPKTDDAGEDEYSYGYRLWEAKFYPEAEQQLKLFLEKYPRHKRASWGRNLLGRAYLDERNPSEAAKWFLQNYQTDKRGERAPDSLLYLGISMKQLKDTKRACIALAEFSDTYAAEAAGRLKSLYDSARSGLACS